MDALELLAHPVRLRIVHALSGGQIFTTAQLCERIADVSKATVYRHIGLLNQGGLLEVCGEQRVRGAVERSYRLRGDRTVVDQETFAALTADDHRRAFSAAMATLIAEFNAYLGDDGADPAADSVGYRQHAIWLSDEERAALIEGLRAAILPHATYQPAPGRRRHLLSPVLFPLHE